MSNFNATPSTKVRYHERWNLMYYLRVYAQPSGQLLGHLVDINTEGAMIISDKPLTVNNDFILSMELPDVDGHITPMVMSASIVWSRPDVNPHFVGTGIQLIEPTQEAIDAVSRLINNLKSFGPLERKVTEPPAELDLQLKLPE